jgi:hypothetical protein
VLLHIDCAFLLPVDMDGNPTHSSEDSKPCPLTFNAKFGKRSARAIVSSLNRLSFRRGLEAESGAGLPFPLTAAVVSTLAFSVCPACLQAAILHTHTELVPWKPPKRAWTALNSSISARAGTGFAAMPDGMLYVIGGGVGGTNSVICLLCATCCYAVI